MSDRSEVESSKNEELVKKTKYCRSCPFLNLSEEMQHRLWRSGARGNLEHYCYKYGKRLKHELPDVLGGHSRVILKCQECEY